MRQDQLSVGFTTEKKKSIFSNKLRIVKPTGLFVNEDVAEATMAKRREQMPRLRQAKQDGKIAYFVLDKLIIKDKRPRQN